MCQIIVKPEGKRVDFKKLDIAQTHNEDGYGVTWYDDETGELETFKTMNYVRFKAILSTLKHTQAVIHLRKTSRGDTCVSNNHPFPIPNGMLFHNGTIRDLTCSTKGGSDTLALAELLNECTYEYIDDIMPLIKGIIGDTLNKLVIYEDDGIVTIVNKDLGVYEDGIWYSNTYHHKEKVLYTYTTKNTIPYEYHQENDTATLSLESNDSTAKLSLVPTTTTKTSKVFVYGTLKKGFANECIMGDTSKFTGKAVTLERWAMVGDKMPFPYLLFRDTARGKIIKGEVYEVDMRVLSNLDTLEGIPTHYVRTQVDVIVNGVSERVLTYVKAGEIPEWLTGKDYISEFTSKRQWDDAK